MTSRCYIGVGANLQNPAANCLTAINCLDRLEFSMVGRVSKFYRTEPHGLKDQPWFVNAVVEMFTEYQPLQLLACCLEIERRMGRIRMQHWGPRIIDLDVLLMDDLIFNHETLTIPHPHLHQRRFVLQPLADLIPDELHPILKVSYRTLLERVHDSASVEEMTGISWQRSKEQT